MSFFTERNEAHLVLRDGAVFRGEAIGAHADDPESIATGEVIFNTSLTGYQEIITDPSYAGQVITFTYPHIGNYGVNANDCESHRPFCRGVIVRDLSEHPSSWRSQETLEAFLLRHKVGGLTGIDTRRLTRHIRSSGSMSCAFGRAPIRELLERAQKEPGTTGMNLVDEVSTKEPYQLRGPELRVVAYDFGLKRAILDNLALVASVEVVPARTPASEVLDRRPDGVFLSNGPGDPSALAHLVEQIEGLLGEVPIFGICLGHQLLATALGASTFKLDFGHHGGNHPVKRLETGVVEVTAQNHGYAVAEQSLEGAVVTHRNLNDGVVEGIRATGVPALSVQYHPEAGPGPHDARYLFQEFESLMLSHKTKAKRNK